jgi:hypothetical protein
VGQIRLLVDYGFHLMRAHRGRSKIAHSQRPSQGGLAKSFVLVARYWRVSGRT